jgi:hypothetical protein
MNGTSRCQLRLLGGQMLVSTVLASCRGVCIMVLATRCCLYDMCNRHGCVYHIPGNC